MGNFKSLWVILRVRIYLGSILKRIFYHMINQRELLINVNKNEMNNQAKITY